MKIHSLKLNKRTKYLVSDIIILLLYLFFLVFLGSECLNHLRLVEPAISTATSYELQTYVNFEVFGGIFTLFLTFVLEFFLFLIEHIVTLIKNRKGKNDVEDNKEKTEVFENE